MKVFVNLTSAVTDENREVDTLPAIRSIGMLKHNGNTLRLSFPMEGQMQTLIFEEDKKNTLELRRENGFMLFDCSQPTEGLYKVEHLALLPTIHTHRLTNTVTMSGGELTLDYTLDFEGQKQHFHMEIEVSVAP